MTKLEEEEEGASRPKLEIMDFQYSLDLMEDEKLAFEAYDMFHKGLLEHAKSLTAAYEEDDVASIRRICHDIKGETSCCGAPQIRDALERLHSSIKDKDASKEELQKEFNSLIFSLYKFIAFYPGYRLMMGA